jgi:preprotein translocase subunit SecA
MFGRRYSDGLHQAIEAKEGVPIKHESQTLATITFQNLFRLYLKLAGMTGTAKTEEDEFRKIYGLDVVMVPTNRPNIRKDLPDVIYKRHEHKLRGIAAEILGLYARQQPVLVGTRSIDMSEKVSDRISGISLQTLAMVSLIRTRLDNSKSVDKAKREQFEELLNQDLEKLTLGKLQPLAREFGLNPDPLANDNIREIATMLEVPVDGPTVEQIDEAMRFGIKHNVLNAKYHEKEAVMIAEAGRKGAVTIATNMAGRGVDILLGGKPADMQLPPGQDATLEAPALDAPPSLSALQPAPGEPDDSAGHGDHDGRDDHEEVISVGDEEVRYVPEQLKHFQRGGKPGSVLSTVTSGNPEEHQAAAEEVRKTGGLFILGTERHESRRIDNQLRGRAGRQGDPGASRFYVSLEDELWRLFGDRTQSPLLRGWPDHEAMDARILSKMIERAQKKVEEYHFESRKQVLNYDDVMNRQREIIYGERRRILEGANLRGTILNFLDQTVADAVVIFCPETEQQDSWDLEGLYTGMQEYFPLEEFAQEEDLRGKSREELQDLLYRFITEAYERKEAEVSELTGDAEVFRNFERYIALQVINQKWMEHLAAMDYLREGIFLRGYAQQDPLAVYQKEGFELFENMQHSIQDEIARTMFNVQFAPQMAEPEFEEIEMEYSEPEPPRKVYNEWLDLSHGGGTTSAPPPSGGNGKKPGRNDPCWCGSGRKYKVCHCPD